MASDKKDFFGKTVADAIQAASKKMGAPQERLDIEVIETGSSGIFGLIRKKAQIRVALKEEQDETNGEELTFARKKKEAKAPAKKKKQAPRQESAKKSEPVVAKEPQKEQEPCSPEDCRLIEDELKQILQLMDFSSTVELKVEDRTVRCQIESESEEELIGPKGKTLEALQYLIRKMVARKIDNQPKITIDIGNYRQRRLEELKEKARELGEKVKNDGRTRAIPSLNPSERRIVHLELQSDGGVKSRSVGDGPFKKVLIFKPGKKRRSSGRSRSSRSGRKNNSRKKKDD